MVQWRYQMINSTLILYWMITICIYHGTPRYFKAYDALYKFTQIHKMWPFWLTVCHSAIAKIWSVCSDSCASTWVAIVRMLAPAQSQEVFSYWESLSVWNEDGKLEILLLPMSIMTSPFRRIREQATFYTFMSKTADTHSASTSECHKKRKRVKMSTFEHSSKCCVILCMILHTAYDF